MTDVHAPASGYAPTGMVCAVDALAAATGVALLRAGGTAADAAVGASAVLAVTTQHMCGMGGDLFAMAALPGGPPLALQAAGAAGSGADAARLRAEGHRSMPPRNDIRSVPVPGCVDGWLALHGRLGRLPLAEVLEPARAYAANGFPVTPTLAAAIPLVAGLPAARDYAGPVRPGRLLRRPGVARALAALARSGRRGFYEGEFGEGLLELGAGEYTEDDLRASQARWVEPVAVDAWGGRLWTVPPPSQGYLTAAGAWIAGGLHLPGDPADALWPHLLVEAARQAAWDRPAVLHEHADGAALVAPARLAPRRAAVRAEAVGAPAPPAGPGGTIALCAVDAERRGVALVQSNASGWGAHIVEPRTGIFLQNRGIGFSLVPGHPAEYGPRRRPPSTLSPAVVTGDGGRLRLALGTMGGDSQPQILLQLLARVLAGGEGPGPAVAAGRWVLAPATHDGTGFDTWTAGGVRVLVEATAPERWDAGLRTRGHLVTRVPAGHGFGHAHVVLADEDNVLAGGTDPRALSGAASGY